MSQLTFDKKEHSHYLFNTPVTPPTLESERVALRPGTCVMQRGVDPMKALCGVVHKNEPEGCVVIGHGWDASANETFLWRGTKREFDNEWKID